MRRRLDAELLRRGLVSSRTEAQEAIRGALVSVSGMTILKPSSMVGPDDPIVLGGQVREFVSRGGKKLSAALEGFGLDPAGLRCLDAGASTGGFTDCLLKAGATAVIAVDVGYGQLDWLLRNDDRVTVMERTNVRNLLPSDLAFEPELVVADLSFISLRTVIPALVGLGGPGASFVFLIKPQFEAGRGLVGDGGVVSDPGVWRDVVRSVIAALAEAGAPATGIMASPVRGPAGNVEFLVAAVEGGSVTDLDVGVDSAIADGLALREGA